MSTPGGTDSTSAGWDAAAALAAQAESLRARLAELEQDFTDIVEATAHANVDDEHDPEGSTIAFERSQVSALAAQARDHLAEVEAAQQRLADGTYGVCEVCGNDIPVARLEARPTARTCVACASQRR